jgi:CheY-like chemotaxis protein/HPt (histidine-containing phosphotransfer) domain-containing protein
MTTDENVLKELVAMFRGVCADRMATLERTFADLAVKPDSGPALSQAAREIHTLKGEAKLLGFELVYRVAHCMDALVRRVMRAGVPMGDDTRAFLAEGLALIEDLRQEDPGVSAHDAVARAYCTRGDAFERHGHKSTRPQNHPRTPLRGDDWAPVASSRRGWRVLLLDDSKISLELARAILAEEGFEVRATTTLSDFDDILQDWSPEVILTDVTMPGMTGVELCRVLKRRYDTAHVPIVLCSTLSQDELAELAQECEADGYVSKNDRLNGLGDELRALCESNAW